MKERTILLAVLAVVIIIAALLVIEAVATFSSYAYAYVEPYGMIQGSGGFNGMMGMMGNYQNTSMGMMGNYQNTPYTSNMLAYCDNMMDHIAAGYNATNAH